MHALDTRALYEQPITDDGHQPDDMDDDLFVAARVAITAAGHTTWQTIHDDPATVTQRVDWPIADAEHLLDLIDPDPETRVNTPDSVETRTNPHGWPPPEAHTTPSSSAAAGGGQDWLRVGVNLQRASMRPWRGTPWAHQLQDTATRLAREEYQPDQDLARRFLDGHIDAVTVELILTTRPTPGRRWTHHTNTDRRLTLTATCHVQPDATPHHQDWLRAELAPLLTWGASVVSIDG